MFIMIYSVYPRKRYKYVGMKECARCHNTDSIGNQVKIWGESPHSKAYNILRTGPALEIAQKYGIDKPAESKQCLRCHTTSGGRNTDLISEGVGCEACHGPGEGYYEFNNHASFTNRQAAYLKAIKLGMYPIIGIDHIKTREKMCRRCHSMDQKVRLCLPDDPKKRKEDILALEIIADFIFAHPVK